MIDKDMIDRLLALGPDEPATPINGCHCDFCTLKKKYEDNWCTLCAEVKMVPPKWWENEDVCDKCESEFLIEEARAELQRLQGEDDK